MKRSLVALVLIAAGCCPGREAAVEVVREARVLLRRPVAGASPEWEAARLTFLADAARVAPEDEEKK